MSNPNSNKEVIRILSDYHIAYKVVRTPINIMDKDENYWMNEQSKELYSKLSDEYKEKYTVLGQAKSNEVFKLGSEQRITQEIEEDGHFMAFERIFHPLFDEYGSDLIAVIETAIDKTTEVKRLRQMEKLSVTDHLTGILNRRGIANAIRREFKESLRYEKDGSIIIADIDNFKPYNKFGLPFGDEVIKLAARLLKESVREVDVLGRYGGDEFLVLLPHTNLENALEFAERFRKKVEENVEIIQKREVRMTMSIGVIDFKSSHSERELIAKVDKALTSSKETGKNRVTNFAEITKK